MSTPAIEARSLQKSYGDVVALDGLDLRVPAGSFFGLLGPNGAGKTTFIETLVGLVRADSGSAAVFGHDVEADYRAARDAVGLAPQEFNVDRFFPIHEVLAHKAGYHGYGREEARERASWALDRVGLSEKRDQRFSALSGGMKRRVILARALVTDPDLLILDEPTAGVDVQLRRDLWKTVTDLNEDGTTVLLTTHYIEEAERLCDEVAIMSGGRVVETATPDALMRRGTDRITVTLRNPPATPPDLTAGDDRVRDVALEGSRLVVTATEGGLVAPDLVRELDRKGLDIVDLDVSRTSLEEVFVELTDAGHGGLDTGAEGADADGSRVAETPATDGGR
ncbi:MAG: ATP-binding cassette domain-containing protein [Haloferacaceae archaeon]